MNVDRNNTISRAQSGSAVQQQHANNSTAAAVYGSVAQRGRSRPPPPQQQQTGQPVVISTRNWLEEQQQKFQRAGVAPTSASAPTPSASLRGRPKSNTSDSESSVFQSDINDFSGRLQAAISNSSRMVSLRNTPQGFGLNVAVYERDGFRLPYVPCVIDSSVAHQAGLRTGDFILEVNGNDVTGENIQWCSYWLTNCGDILTLKVTTPTVGDNKTHPATDAPTHSLNSITSRQPEVASVTKKIVVEKTEIVKQKTQQISVRHESISSSAASSVGSGSMTTLSSFGTSEEEDAEGFDTADVPNLPVQDLTAGSGMRNEPETPTSDYSSAPDTSSSDDSVSAILPMMVSNVPLLPVAPSTALSPAVQAPMTSQVSNSSTIGKVSVRDLRSSLDLHFAPGGPGLDDVNKRQEVTCKAKPIVNRPTPTTIIPSPIFSGVHQAETSKTSHADRQEVVIRPKISSDDAMDFLRQAEKMRQEYVRKSAILSNNITIETHDSRIMQSDGTTNLKLETSGKLITSESLLGNNEGSNDLQTTQLKQTKIPSVPDHPVGQQTDEVFIIAGLKIDQPRPSAPPPSKPSVAMRPKVTVDQPKLTSAIPPLRASVTPSPVVAKPRSDKSLSLTMSSDELQQKLQARRQVSQENTSSMLDRLPPKPAAGPTVSSKPLVLPKTAPKHDQPSNPAGGGMLWKGSGNEAANNSSNNVKRQVGSPAHSSDDVFVLPPPPPMYGNLPPVVPDSSPSAATTRPPLLPASTFPQEIDSAIDVSRSYVLRSKPPPPLRRESSTSVSSSCPPPSSNAGQSVADDRVSTEFDSRQDLPPPVFNFLSPVDAVNDNSTYNRPGTRKSGTAELSPNSDVMTSSVSKWNVNDVGNWLDQLTLSEHRRNFCQNGIDGIQLLTLDRNKLIELGVCDVQHRMIIERQLRKLVLQANNV